MVERGAVRRRRCTRVAIGPQRCGLFIASTGLEMRRFRRFSEGRKSVFSHSLTDRPSDWTGPSDAAKYRQGAIGFVRPRTAGNEPKTTSSK